MKSYEQFIVEITQQDIDKAAPGMSPEKRRAAFEKNARNQARRETPATPKKPKGALPPGKTGGAMEKRTSSELVKAQSKALNKKPSNDVQKVKVKVDDMEGQRGNRPGSTKGPAPKPAEPKKRTPTGFRKGFKSQWDRKTAGLTPQGLGKKTANFITDLPGNTANFVKSGLKNKTPAVGISKPGDLPPVKRGTRPRS